MSAKYRAAQVYILEKTLEVVRSGDATLEYIRIRFTAVKGTLSYTAPDAENPQGSREGGIRILPVGDKPSAEGLKRSALQGKEKPSEGVF